MGVTSTDPAVRYHGTPGLFRKPSFSEDHPAGRQNTGRAFNLQKPLQQPRPFNNPVPHHIPDLQELRASGIPNQLNAR